MRKLPIDESALEAANENLCCKCGSERVVSSFYDFADRTTFEFPHWLCKQCYHDTRNLSDPDQVMFSQERVLDYNLTDRDGARDFNPNLPVQISPLTEIVKN